MKVGLRDERHSLGYLGMVIFLGSWAMMFGAFFFVYAALRIGSPTWPPTGTAPLPLLLPGLSTMIILLSSTTLQRGFMAVQAGRTRELARWLLLTIAVGALFLVVQVIVWQRVAADGLHASSGTYGSIFYTLTVFHFLHVIVGLGMLLWIVPASLRRGEMPERARLRLRLVAMFWHFVSIVWAAIYLAVYVL